MSKKQSNPLPPRSKQVPIELGVTVKDIVSGFSGIVTARIEYLNGCIQYCVKAKAIKNKMEDGVWLDENQLDVVDKGILDKINSKKPEDGGSTADAPASIGLMRL